ncbi:inhibitor of nuclear factor kappa-B kinase subunit alpha isoform X5 [Prionailurus iriomotensis]
MLHPCSGGHAVAHSVLYFYERKAHGKETVAQMIEENLNCLGHLSTIIHEANEEQGSSMMERRILIGVG